MTIRPNKRRFAIALYALSGWTAWGVDLDRRRGTPQLVCDEAGRGIMCCGHVLSPAEIDKWRVAGLLVAGETTPYGRATWIAGPDLERWVEYAWHEMRARRWAR